jgi:CheY-like chemotaxis protein
MAGPFRVLIVEDEMIIAMMLEDTLADLGHQVVGVAMRLPQAMELATTVEADLAILDINLDGKKSFPVAQVLADRGVRVVFASGYGAPGLEAPFLDAVVMKKPFEAPDIRSAINRAMGV